MAGDARRPHRRRRRSPRRASSAPSSCRSTPARCSCCPARLVLGCPLPEPGLAERRARHDRPRALPLSWDGEDAGRRQRRRRDLVRLPALRQPRGGQGVPRVRHQRRPLPGRPRARATRLRGRSRQVARQAGARRLLRRRLRRQRRPRPPRWSGTAGATRGSARRRSGPRRSPPSSPAARPSSTCSPTWQTAIENEAQVERLQGQLTCRSPNARARCPPVPPSPGSRRAGRHRLVDQPHRTRISYVFVSRLRAARRSRSACSPPSTPCSCRSPTRGRVRRRRQLQPGDRRLPLLARGPARRGVPA